MASRDELHSKDKTPVTTAIETADVIVIGAGVAGLSTAMQLAKRGQKVVVVERERLGNGSTGRAAGLLGQLRGTEAHTAMLMDGVEVVKELEREADVEIFIQTGSLRIAETPDRAQEIKDLVAMGKSIDFNIDHVSREQVAEMLPYMKTDDLIDACFCPTDGHLQPAELVSAYVTVGKAHGVIFHNNLPVEKILVEGGRVKGVRTARGEFHAAVVVNAGGPWSYLVAELADQKLATAALGHYYLATRPDPDHVVDRLSPAIRNRHHRIYARPDAGGLLVGMYEAEPVEYDVEDLPVDFDMSTMKAARDDYNVALLIHSAQQRYPWINERTPMTITHGIMTFTPDGKPFCGAMSDVAGLFHCAGFSGHGIVQSPTIGVIMADLILNGSTKYDIEAIEADRFFDIPGYQTRPEVKEKCRNMFASYYGRVEGKTATASNS
ncbi:MAG: FAD-binding oxidoreductase [Planctomycetota bacterium]|nr:MAG: FAD-binding oxidoreductase [Planctomycetota bacterium]REJ95051.1 MAG: FAD-binding oxidoreductase [Planctomycetota bacterium]